MSDTIERRMAQFFQWAMQEGPFDGCGIEGDALQDKAVSLGLLVETKYDPVKHGPSEWVTEDDRWYVFADDVKSFLPKGQAS